MKKGWLAVICVLAMAVSLCGCGPNKVLEYLREDDVLISGTTQREEGGKSYVLYASTNTLELWLNEDTTEIQIVDRRTGYRWESSNPERADETSLVSPLNLTYLNPNGLLSTMDIMTNSVISGQYRVEAIKSGVSVTYSVGRFQQYIRLPKALTPERLNELVQKIEDEFEAQKFELAYVLIEPENAGEYLSEYPMLKDKPMYIIQNSIWSSVNKRSQYADILKSAGYTQEEYEKDSADLPQEEAEVEPAFRIQIQYVLNDDSLTVILPADEIQMRDEYPLLQVDVLPYFGSPTPQTEGHFVIPDGSGAIMNFYNGKGDRQSFSMPVYGQDDGIVKDEKLYNTRSCSLPVFGIVRDGNGILAVIEGGDSIADINAFTGSEALPGYVYADFKLRSYYKSFLKSAGAGATDYFMIAQDKRFSEDVRMCYHFIGDNADYNQLAHTYRGLLFADEKRSSNSHDVIIDYLTMVTKNSTKFGFSYTENVVTTSFAQVLACTNAWKEYGFSDVSVKLSGWMNGGYLHGYVDKIRTESALENELSLQELERALAEKQITLYPDVDVQYTYSNRLFDSYSADRDVAMLISKEKAVIKNYNPVTFVRDGRIGYTAYMNNLPALNKALTGADNALKEYQFRALSLRSSGVRIGGDYKANNEVFREEFIRSVVSRAAEWQEENYALLFSGTNAYILPYATAVTDVEFSSSGLDMMDADIPFLQMVLSGKVNYCSLPLNLEADMEQVLLSMAATASGMYYRFTAQNDDVLKDADLTAFYSTDFSSRKEEEMTLAKEYLEAVGGLCGETIRSFSWITDTCSVTEFQTGEKIVVNYGYEEQAYGVYSVGARDYLVISGGETE